MGKKIKQKLKLFVKRKCATDMHLLKKNTRHVILLMYII